MQKLVDNIVQLALHDRMEFFKEFNVKLFDNVDALNPESVD
jgi:hypothetical protein